MASLTGARQVANIGKRCYSCGSINAFDHSYLEGKRIYPNTTDKVNALSLRLGSGWVSGATSTAKS